MRLSLRPVSRFALDFDSPADTEDFTLALDVDEAGSGSTTPALTFSSCAVSPEAGQTEFAEWGSEGRLAYLCSSEAAQSGGCIMFCLIRGVAELFLKMMVISRERWIPVSIRVHLIYLSNLLGIADPEMAGDAARPFEVRACVLAPSSICESSPSNSDSDRMPLPGVPLDTGACPAHASTALYISSSPPALPLPLPQQHSEPDASAHDYYAVRRSGSRSPTTLFWAPRAPEEASDPMIGPQPGLKAADGFIDAEAVAAGQLIGAGVLADPTTSCWGDLRDSSDSCTSPASSATCSVSTSTSTLCRLCLLRFRPSLCQQVSRFQVPTTICRGSTARTTRTLRRRCPRRGAPSSSTRFLTSGPTAPSAGGTVLGPPGGWPGERASTYGFVHPGERERRGSAATVTGQRLSLTLRRESAVASAHAKRASVSSATPAATFPRTRKVSASVPSPAPRQSAASTSRVSAAPSGSVRRSAASAVCADSVSVASRPVSGSVRDEQRLSRAPERASYAEKERGSNVRDSASLRAAQRNTFGIQSSTPSPRDASSSKLSIAGRESTSRITSATLPAPVPIDTTDKTANNNASSSQPPSPSTLSTGSSSSPPPPIPPRSGRRPGSRAGGAAASDRQKDRAVGIVVGARASSSSASPAGSTPATTPEREKDMPALKRTSHSRSVSRGNAKYFGEVKQDPLASRTPPTNGAVRAFVVSPGDTERGRVSYDSFKANGAGAAGKKNGSAFTGLWQYELEAVDGEDRGYGRRRPAGAEHPHGADSAEDDQAPSQG
ncbi:hypothetical protein NEOLEDRAFT_137166 [Neolentinus lepideus HHB14362 ss-1]|uniref:Uncharacterized protein n=1 Tax=Neolentinus lepideus HHB14362 ss-1 TaxID=1314782 RepID=A0A165TYN9_9AGAM|nr:hypothetical protein NEOLEDRAFT_137166 [Neolentinus lepideus HHB14362 ss-1]